MRFHDLTREMQRFGKIKTLQNVLLRAANRLVVFKILKGVRIDTVKPAFLQTEKPYRAAFLTEAELLEIGRGHPEYEMSGAFLREAFSKGDECYGLLDGPVLAAYGWYSNQPTALDAPGVVLEFDPR